MQKLRPSTLPGYPSFESEGHPSITSWSNQKLSLTGPFPASAHCAHTFKKRNKKNNLHCLELMIYSPPFNIGWWSLTSGTPYEHALRIRSLRLKAHSYFLSSGLKTVLEIRPTRTKTFKETQWNSVTFAHSSLEEIIVFAENWFQQIFKADAANLWGPLKLGLQ